MELVNLLISVTKESHLSSTMSIIVNNEAINFPCRSLHTNFNANLSLIKNHLLAAIEIMRPLKSFSLNGTNHQDDPYGNKIDHIAFHYTDKEEDSYSQFPSSHFRILLSGDKKQEFSIEIKFLAPLLEFLQNRITKEAIILKEIDQNLSYQKTLESF